MPILARSATLAEWAGITIGQSIGAIGTIIISTGWSVTGPGEAARSTGVQLQALLAECAMSRATVALPVWTAIWGCALFLPGLDERLLVGATATATSVSGFSIAWYAVGAGRPAVMARYEALPRATGNILGAILTVASGSVLLYPITVAVAQCAPLIAFMRAETAGSRQGFSLGQVAARIRRNIAAVATELMAGAFTLGAPAIVGLAANTSTVALFSSGDRVIRLGTACAGALGSALRGWVAEADGPEFVRRAAWSFRLHLLLGITGLAFLAFAGPSLTGLLFGQNLRISGTTAAALGAFFLLWCIGTVTGPHILAARGRTRALFTSTAVGSAVGVAGVWIGARLVGTNGAAVAVAVALGCAVLCQGVPVARVISAEKNRRATEAEQTGGTCPR
jgi:O-antigen/teichoic acid export membrane protein